MNILPDRRDNTDDSKSLVGGADENFAAERVLAPELGTSSGLIDQCNEGGVGGIAPRQLPALDQPDA